MGEYPQARVRAEEALALTEEAIAAGSPLAGDLLIKQTYIRGVLAYTCIEAGDLDGALEHVERAAKVARAKRLPGVLCHLNTIAAHIYLRQGRIDESLGRYRGSVELLRKGKIVPALSQSLRILGEVLLGLDRYAEALLCLEEAASLFAQLEDRETEALLWTEIAGAHQAEENHTGAMAAWSRARALRKRLGDPAGELEALEGLAAATRRHAAEPALVLAYYYEAVQLAQALVDHAAEGRLRNTLGILEWSRGEYAQALQHYELAFAIFGDLRNTAHAGLMLNSVAITLKQLGQLAEAQNRFIEAVALHRKTGQLQLEAHALAALGDISTELGDAEGAAEHYKRSLEIRRQTGDHRGEGWMLYNLARGGGAGGTAAEMVLRASELAAVCSDQELITACEQLRSTSRY
jgi:tetratricopeptide (TPR) repeat protein